ncbi:MAG TPA: endolytic transglycosylase MltG [Candidatus Magasanikbacteria bacterium]|nr:MAG: hypothetical protein A3I74_04375 [Candidatus Magasanikbacteria bacterium RIFCSPLOWO2_02_FULL_47_16]OGH79391.1 MAG: hypothetical protein A3C10_04910 [Candidatus Magasanikbacteria bacterium RIFCSPHIGHO2_02_FULL_48_18]OGH82491.1 MAG: hypothetical protein A3G08_00735 [Candidatus Magasanikbacteria bacterium RIFCSPLOWO2_12_FULL_47_9b]HAZ28748.1 endolytic transglycosylase MltG [Candidatus Magasanikbacteria bacterium]
MKKSILGIAFLCVVFGAWFVFSEIYFAEALPVERLAFDVKQGESSASLARRLEEEGVIRNAWLFRRYVLWKGMDKTIQYGSFVVETPITMARVVKALLEPGVNEKVVTIIPGWDFRDMATYFVAQGFVETEEQFFRVAGPPANNRLDLLGYTTPILVLEGPLTKEKPRNVSFEGYFRPDTYRVFQDDSIENVLKKLFDARVEQFTDTMYADMENFFTRVYPDANQEKTLRATPHDMLTMASIVEREVRSTKDRALVADIFWRRYMVGMALQADSTVHYAVGKKGDVFTTKEDRDSLNPWNTYQYPGLPPGPIATPSLESIMAAIYPAKNDYWYFLTTLDGEVKYAETLEEHNKNRAKYL